jgi:electron transfer flavoprotein beta subunit
MRITVCFKEVIDTTVDLGFGRVNSALVEKAGSCRLDPVALDCLQMALKLKSQFPGAEVQLISIGTDRVEEYLRQGLAAGADRATRICSPLCQELSPFQKAKILHAALRLSKAEVVLCGARSLDSGSGLTASLAAGWLDIPCVTDVSDVRKGNDAGTFAVTRRLGRGQLEELEILPPAILGIKAAGARWPDTSLDKLLDSQIAEIELLNPADLGLPENELKSDRAQPGKLVFPRPPTRVVPLDSQLPAYYRILALLEGGIRKRKGELLKGTPDELAGYLLELLIKEKVLKIKAIP